MVCCLLFVDNWLSFVVCCVFACCLLFDVWCLVCVVRCLSLVACWLPPGVNCLLSTAWGSVIVVCFLLFGGCWLLRVV